MIFTMSPATVIFDNPNIGIKSEQTFLCLMSLLAGDQFEITEITRAIKLPMCCIFWNLSYMYNAYTCVQCL